MMNRQQRLEYEILSCALNESGADGFSTRLPLFQKRLKQLFTDVEAFEFTDACRRLYRDGALRITKSSPEGRIEYQGENVMFFYQDTRQRIQLHPTPLSMFHLGKLLLLIEAPLVSKAQVPS